MLSEAFHYQSLGQVKVAKAAKNNHTGNPIILVFVGQAEDCFYQEILEDGIIRSGQDVHGTFYASYEPIEGRASWVTEHRSVDSALAALEETLELLSKLKTRESPFGPPPLQKWYAPQVLGI
jgi:hypothetical protein